MKEESEEFGLIKIDVCAFSWTITNTSSSNMYRNNGDQSPNLNRDQKSSGDFFPFASMLSGKVILYLCWLEVAYSQ